MRRRGIQPRLQGESRKRLTILLLFLVVIIVAGCVASVVTDYDRSALGIGDAVKWKGSKR